MLCGLNPPLLKENVGDSMVDAGSAVRPLCDPLSGESVMPVRMS